MPSPERRGRPRIRTILMATAGVALVALFGLLGLVAHLSLLVPALFKLNRQCQEEGYYMAEFEFKMLGFAYQLDKGRYREAVSGIRRLRDQLASRKGLVKVPEFHDRREELQFYLARQNPRTGAFMDDSFPYCTYDGPTQNVLSHIEALAQEAGQPLQLRYPLKYLDEINTPQRLTAYLDDVSTVGWIASRLPQTSFVFARELLSHCKEGSVLERNNLYALSTDWKHAMFQWFYVNQDPETGFWGPKSRWSGKLLRLDLTNTSSIVEAFVDREGNNIHPQFPLRRKPEMFTTALKVMSEPPPAEDDLDEWHERALKMGKGIHLLTRYLWKDASAAQRAAAAEVFQEYLRVKFDRYFIPGEGAFSYYPGSHHATLDGTSAALSVYSELGAFSSERQQRLWGGSEKTCVDLGRFAVPTLTEKELAPLAARRNVNSVRFYAGTPAATSYASGVAGVFYLHPATVVDAVELVPRVRTWLGTTTQSMGNWVSRAELLDRLSRTGVVSVPAWRQEIPLAAMNRVLRESRALTLIGFDVLQVPRCRIIYYLVS